MSIVLIFDCGATNLRTIAIDEKGQMIASYHLPNQTHQGKENASFHIWDFEEIWEKLCVCAENTLYSLKEKHIYTDDILAISVTTFGVDGAPFDKNGNQLYPIISWKCPRTVPIMETLNQYLDVEKLYQQNGIGHYSFNTLFKLIWLKEYQPDIYAKMDKFVFISSMITHRLTEKWCTDRTMAGTSMMTNLQTGCWEQDVINVLGLKNDHFPLMKNAGDHIGQLSNTMAAKFGLKEIPVISCGHDTQFAIFGSGASLNQPILSSGTWEILMVRTENAYPDIQFLSHGLTTELDAQPNCFNPAVQWIGSGVLEWIGKTFFSDLVGRNEYYPTMISEGKKETRGSGGVRLEGCFSVADYQADIGKIVGLSITTRRGQIYRAALEYMAQQLKSGLSVLEQFSRFKAESLICVGGGSKNTLWNQIRADVLGIPIDVLDVAESTVLGAAMFAFTGVGYYSDINTAQQTMKPGKNRIEPT